MNHSVPTPPAIDSRRFTYALLCVLLGPGAVTLALQTIFSSQDLAGMYVSVPLWEALLSSWGATLDPTTQTVAIPFFPLMGYLLLTAALTWLAGGFLISRLQKSSYTSALTEWGCLGYRWWFLPGAWELLRILLFIIGWSSGEGLLLATSQFWFAITLAGWLATLVTLLFPASQSEAPAEELSTEPKSSLPLPVWLLMGVFIFIFTWMNWRLYQGLLIPHGDSAMYEEHLWNVLHGKGFRSYLDQGLFWGEHIQFIHLLLSPLYLIWPSHLLLELSETVALACGAIPLYRMATRHSGSKTAGTAIVAAYLCYFPLQFLDIAIDLKTFRPISFGVPLLLFALEAIERKRWKSAIVLLLLCLAAKEDYAIILGPLGLWIAWRAFQEQKSASKAQKSALLKSIAPGIGLSVFAVVYLALVVKVLIPWFRGGTQVHYVGYFQKFGNSLGEVVSNILFNPGLLLGELIQPDTFIYALALLVPLGLLPLFSPGRLLVGLPLFGLLCLNELAHDPRHHFHAPIVPILCWAAAYGVGNVTTVLRRWKSEPAYLAQTQTWATHFLWSSSLATGLFFSLGPAGLVFWDSGSNWYWGQLYVPGERARQFEKIADLIPPESRVASTDFVHPRYTHHARSYDYSNYRRKVNDYEAGVPEDTDYIVIDTQHPYSEIKTPDQISEYREHPDEWELLPDKTDGYFIVLKRKQSSKSATGE